MVYDVSRAFERIENELLESMIRNLKKHKAEETELGFEWTQWQAIQLEELQRFKIEAAKKYGLEFKSMNQKIRETIAEAMMQGASDEEVNVLKAIEKGLVINREQGLSAGFFQANQKRLDALINAVEHDMKTAQTAVLRYTNDQYRKIIFQSQVAASSGALTYDKAVDMATSDFLKKGINCITYSNGAVHNIASYADMAVRTASKRAYLMGEGQKRQEWGISTVILNKRFNACPLCMPFEGKVLIDDVWSGGSAKDGPYPLMSSAMAAGLYHPNCKDKHSTYFEGISPKPESRYYEEKPVIKERQLIENKLNHAKRQTKSYNRLAKNSLDAENQETYRARATEWRDKVKEYREQLNSFEESNGLELKGIEPQSKPEYNYVNVEGDVLKRIKASSDRWFKKLTGTQQESVRLLTGGKYYHDLNEMAYNEYFNPSNREELENMANVLDESFKKFKLKDDIVAYRGMSRKEFNQILSGNEFKEFKHLSIDEKVAKQFAKRTIDDGVVVKFYLPKGTNGAYIGDYSIFKNEQEFVLNRNAKYEAIWKSKNEMEVYVYA
ncbi:phage minor capsid protein [uncultured Granulicatella sp.]|uniref:phage minor capsid protein n=1 Tax=uncultured Granulicatella sp. TaxID=316089 RepID=UPI0028D8BA2F|nr:phage minor capsid protein [uncultured Granulicatella sp.]